MGADARVSFPPPARGGEDVELRTKDGVVLRALVREPEGKMFGSAVLLHAMFARRTEFERAAFSTYFAERGWRTIALDFRGHGESGGKDVEYTYDDFVFRDVPAVLDAARARAKKRPVVVVGHSLGGHVALASQAVGVARADAFLTIAANVWMTELEPSWPMRVLKRGAMRGVRALVDRVGRYPARALGMGSDDESRAYMGDLARFVSSDAWRSRDGKYDYAASLARVDVPVYAVASAGDRLMANVATVRRFHALLGRAATLDIVSRADDGSRAPGHMELVTTKKSVTAWARAEAFLKRELA